MKRCAQKLHSRRGASILLALFLMLVAVMVSAVIVSAAITAANRVKDDTVQQQDALSLSSAEAILTKYLLDGDDAKRYSLDPSEYSDQVYEMSDPDPDPDNPLKKLCAPENVGKAYTMEVSDVPGGMKGAVMDFVLEKDNNIYYIKGTIRLKGETGEADQSSQKIYLKAKVTYESKDSPRTVTDYDHVVWVPDEDDPEKGSWEHDNPPVTVTLTTETWTLKPKDVTASAAEGVLW